MKHVASNNLVAMTQVTSDKKNGMHESNACIHGIN
jgi:hypothetical protein